MKLAGLSIVLLASTAAAADPVAEPEGASETEAISGNVLVWHDATFYTEPSDTAITLRLGALAKPRKERVGHVVPMRVVSTRGAFVEVEPAAELDCTWSRLATPDDIARLRVFVKRADLAPVLAKPFAKTFPDGTKLALKPGVPVVPAADGWFALSIKGNELAAEIPAASVGHAYRVEPRPRVKVETFAAHEYAIAPHTTVKLGDRALVLDGLIATGMQASGDTSLVTIEEHCATVTVAAPSKAVHESEDEDSGSIGGGGGGGVLSLRDTDYIPAVTALSVGSRQVAYAAKPIYLPSVPHGKMACVDRRFRIDTAGVDADPSDTLDDKLRLCAPTAKVVHERMRSASSANGTTTR